MKPPLGMTTILAALAALCLLMVPVSANAAPSFMSDMENAARRSGAGENGNKPAVVTIDGGRNVSGTELVISPPDAETASADSLEDEAPEAAPSPTITPPVVERIGGLSSAPAPAEGGFVPQGAPMPSFIDEAEDVLEKSGADETMVQKDEYRNSAPTELDISPSLDDSRDQIEPQGDETPKWRDALKKYLVPLIVGGAAIAILVIALVVAKRRKKTS